MLLHKGDRCFRTWLLWGVSYTPVYYYKYRQGPVPNTGCSINSHMRYTSKNMCGAHRIASINCDEDHTPFVRHHQKTKNWRSDTCSRTWKNRKLRHQWEVHTKWK